MYYDINYRYITCESLLFSGKKYCIICIYMQQSNVQKSEGCTYMKILHTNNRLF